MRVVSWNVNSLGARLARVEKWLTLFQPDVVCMQETKCSDASFPALAFASLGYETTHHGQGQWNGVAILSRVGLEDPHAGFADGADADPEARVVWATCGGARIASCYVPNGRSLSDDHYQYKLAWLQRLRATLDAQCDPRSDVALLGDFNIAPTDLDVWDPKKFVNATHVSPPERAALAELQGWGLDDVFRTQYPDVDGLYSWWDYRAGSFHKRQGMRIDLVLASASLAARTSWAIVDRNARKGETPSDHAPLIVDFD
jgi:exodeoxyribonuclease-3